jgi:hypothetical protein
MKDWNNIPDDEFDDAFKDLSLNHEEEIWPSAWPRMEEKLEEENRKRRFIIFWRWAAAFLVFGAIGILGLAYFKNSLSDNQAMATKTTEPQAPKKQSKSPVLRQTSKETSFEKTSQSKDLELKTQSAISAIKSKKTKEFITKESKGDFQKQPPKKNNIRELFVIENKVVNAKTIENSPDEIAKNTEHIISNEQTPTSDKIQIDTALVIAKNEPEDFSKEDTTIIATNHSDEIITHQELADMSEVQNNQNPTPFQKLAFSFGFSPDYSRVKTNQFGAMGHNLQIIVDYKINRKFSIKGGLMKSLKLYDADPKNYAWPVKWGTPSSPLMGVSATCNMIDIPVSLSYLLAEKRSNKLYTSLGITNYKMMKEKYVYHYENDADPNLKWKKWEGSSGFFGAGVINMSLGLEHKISNFLSVQIEPFVKVPIKNVGFGSVKLLTTGLFLNLKTQAPTKKTQPK